jgi:TfoX/Sxy family transcriptional regulator of competence genes
VLSACDRSALLPGGQPAGGRLAVSDGFRALVLDNLDGLPSLTARPMFGGLGLYSGSVFFAIVAADMLYFKVDAESRGQYVQRGARRWSHGPVAR